VNVTTSIPLHVALLGGTVIVPTIDGEVELKIPAGTQPEERKRLAKRGIQILGKTTSDRGDQYVTIKVQLPKNLSAKQRKLIEEAFGMKSTSSSLNEDNGGNEAAGKENTAENGKDNEDCSGDSIFSKIKRGLGMKKGEDEHQHKH
jgi:molecular chaperone DnaJ